jgi:Bacterial regulatory proteins, luxR family
MAAVLQVRGTNPVERRVSWRNTFPHPTGLLSNQEIAARLVLSPASARTHVSRAMVKLGARDRAQLVVVAYQTGLVPPTPPA